MGGVRGGVRAGVRAGERVGLGRRNLRRLPRPHAPHRWWRQRMSAACLPLLLAGALLEGRGQATATQVKQHAAAAWLESFDGLQLGHVETGHVERERGGGRGGGGGGGQNDAQRRERDLQAGGHLEM